MTGKNDKPIENPANRWSSYLDYVAMDHEMTGAFPAVNESDAEVYEQVFHEFYGWPVDRLDDEQENIRNHR
ncbi:MAG: hypothetical protein ACI3UZ_07460 [Oscillospiraceae bacterium]